MALAEIADIIKYEGDNYTFLWKHPVEDFNSMTQLIVHEWQEAIFMMNGEALDLFGPGRYTLETQNIPKISGRLNRLVKDKENKDTKTQFHCEVYFINKNVHMAIKWGTDSRVRFIDPETGIPLDIGARGEINLQADDSRKLLVKMVGPGGAFKNHEALSTGSAGTLAGVFRAPLVTEVKTYLASVIKNQKINILEIDEHLGELAEALKPRIIPLFEEYGLTVPNFYVTNVDLPDDDPNFRTLRSLRSRSYLGRKIEEVEADVARAHEERLAAEELAKTETARAAQQRKLVEEETKARLKILEAQGQAEALKASGLAQAEIAKAQGMAEASVMEAKGYSQKDVLEAEVQKAYAEGIGKMGGGSNGGSSPSGGMASDMVNMMMQMKVAGTMMDKMGGMFGSLGGEQTGASAAQKAKEEGSIICPTCGARLPARAKFCYECGGRIEALQDNEVICPACGRKTLKGKFCLECGASLLSKCPACGAEMPLGAKFCLECGNKL